MIGWGIHVFRQKIDRNTIPVSVMSEQGEHVASWESHLDGRDWLEELLKQQKAVCIQEGFYPGIFTAQANNVLPLLHGEPPFVIEYLKWKGDKHEVHPIFRKSKKAIRSCHPDEWLIIEVWDGS